MLRNITAARRDAGLVRTIWCLTGRLRPVNVVETGVAHGMTSRSILEALETDRWTYIAGTSRPRLPALLSRLGRIDLFIYDSMHSNRNVMFELECPWRYPPAASSWSMTSTSIP